MNQFFFFAIAMVFSTTILAQPTPAPKQTESILIVGGTAHLGNGDVIFDAAVGFENGVITFVGNSNKAPKDNYKQIIDGTGKHIYPGFITPNSTLGLQEVGAVRATRDQYEIGTFRPNVRAVIAFNTESEITPTVRTNGVLIGQICPRGGILSGTSGIVHFDGWNWEDAAIVMTDGVHMNWPGMFHKHYKNGKVDIKRRKSVDQTLMEIDDFFEKARAYANGSSEITDLKFEAMAGLFDGSQKLYVHAQDIKQINEAVQFKKKMGIKEMTIVGGYESYLCADLLRDNNVSVMVRRVHDLPRYEGDDIDLPFKLPKLLADEGVLFCLENAGDMEQMGTRNLPFYAGTAAAYGLTYEQAVQSITLNTAKILGIDEMYGSIEVGKSATLFISEGDALDMLTNDVTVAFIDGRNIDLDNRQKQLYRKYKGKYEAIKED
ncbi:MAG: amidohydrolase family protein [Flavobacteriales bacterium]|nr:amidohydrolase family protein [Flavobacteriales bacterium]